MQPVERLDRDFILRYCLASDAVRPSLALHADREGEEGTFVLTVLPPAGSGGAGRPRDVVFVLDRSGSMAGWKMVAARRALGRMIDMLAPRDRFTVYAFDDRIETPPVAGGRGLIPATDRERFRAIEFLARIEARGGTEMARPLDEAVGQLGKASERERDRVLVLVTDGQVGNEDQILRSLGQRLAGIRIFTLGVDRAVNEGFLRRIAAAGGGSCDLVESEDRLDAVMDKVQRRIGEPMLTGLALEPAGLSIDADSVTPSRLPDLFAGSPLVVMGRYRGAATGTVRVAGRDDAGRPWQQVIAAERRDHAAAAPLWARSRLRALEDRYAIGERDREAAAKQIVALSLRFGVLCRFTAFVAVDRSEIVNAGGRQHAIVQPVEAPSGWDMFGQPMAGRGTVLRACVAAGPVETESVDSCRREFRSEARRAPAPKKKGLFRRSQGKPSTPAQTPSEQAAAAESREGTSDLTAYRRQARELLERLIATSTDRARMLAVLAVRLAALLEDLRSVGVSIDAVRPLQELLDALHRLGPSSTDAEVQRAWSMAQAALHAFAEGNTAGVTGRAAEFWK
jgi:Ca-activated chloride channel family protein